ncbi:MAG: hypothetical protein QOJ06_2189, partial [Pseudonocardiales bacterium]|nr:hypothetical protein [Pseudonocardiales bacterium]
MTLKCSGLKQEWLLLGLSGFKSNSMPDRHRNPGIVIRPDPETRAELEQAAQDEGPNPT